MNGIAGSRVGVCLTLLETATLFSNVVVPFYPSICSALGISIDAPKFTSSVDFHSSGRCDTASHCAFNFHSPDSIYQSFL